VGNDKIGGNKLEEMSKSDAIHEFKRLFMEKTGNPWEAWEQKQNFQKQPGRFFPLDIVKILCFYLLIYVLPILALVVVIIDLIIWNFVGLRGKQTGL
jgi:hypothetical protein